MRWIALAGVVGVVGSSTVACAPAASPSEARVWTTANSNDGLATCPPGTAVTGGGYEIKEEDRVAGRVPLVVASRPEANGWRVICLDADGRTTKACRSWATCASVLSR
jgi:hypothetical protein